MATTCFLCIVLCIFAVFNTEAKMVDLTHRLANRGMSYWPGHTKYQMKADLRGPFGKVKWVASNQFTTSEHMGSHLDAPYHVIESGRKLHDISLDELHGPAVVVNIKEKAKRNPNAMVDKQDLLAWEANYGRIPNNAYILMNSGWGQYWGDNLKYMGTGSPSNRTDNLSWPGFSGEASDWLLKERKSFRGVAVDTMSCDQGATTTFPVHVNVLGADKFCIENVANIDKIPPKGAHIYVMPILIQDGTGAPIRLFALVDENMPQNKCNAVLSGRSHILAWVILFFTIRHL